MDRGGVGRWWLIVLIGLLGLGSLPASAQQGFEVLIDTNSRLIGCDVTTPDGVFEGAEYIITVTTSADGSQITALSIRSCNPFDDTFGAPQALPGPPLPIGQGLGTGGSSVLEFAIDAARLGNPVAVRLGLISLDGGSSQDALLTRDGQPDGGAMVVVLIPSPPVPPASIPTLNPWSLMLLVVLLGAAAWLGRRRLRRHPLMLSLLISGLLIGVVWAIELDGDPADWAGIDPLGTDPAGDGIPDIRALFGTRSNGDLALRIDAVLNPVGNPPTAVDNPDFTTLVNTPLNVPDGANDLLANDTLGDPPATLTFFGGGSLGGAVTDNAADSTVNFGAAGSLTVNADGSFDFEPDTDVSGNFTFQYRLENLAGTSDALVTIQVQQMPVAVEDTVAVGSSPGDAFHTALNTTLDSAAAVNTSSVLANDTLGFPTAAVSAYGTSGAPDTQTTLGPPTATDNGGTVSMGADGEFVYTLPSATFTGLDSFGYTLANDAGSDTATVTVAVGIRPAAVADGPRDVTGNVRIDTASSSGFSVLTNDSGDQLSITLFDNPSAQGGNVTLNISTGTFSYNPPPGFEGSDTFTYTITNGFGTDTATVMLTVTDMIWFVDASAAGGDGRLSNPFNDLAGPSNSFGADATDEAGDSIFIADGSYTCGLTLLDNQILVGDGSSGTLAGATGITLATDSDPLPVFSDTDPVLTASNTNCINLASGNTLRGFTVGNTGTGTGIAGNSVGNLVLADTSVTGSGKALDINGGGMVTINLSWVQVTSSNTGGISLQNIGGTSTFGAVNLTTTGGTGFLASNAGTLTVTGSSNTIDSGTTTALNIVNTNIGAGRITFQSISSNGGSTPGIVLDTTGTAGGLTVTGAGGDCKNNVAECSGGSITNKTGNTDGILLTSTANIDLSHMNVSGHSRNGIFGTGVNGFRLNQSRFTDNADQASPDEAAVHFVDSTGSILGGANPTRFDDLLVSNSHEHNVIIRNNSGTITNLAVDNSLFTNDGASTEAGNNFFIDTGGTANVTVSVTGSQFDGSTTAGMLTAFGLVGDAADTSSVTLNASSSSFSDNNVALSASASNAGNVTFDFSDHPTVTGSRSNAINVFANANHTGTISGRIENNVVGTNGVLSSGSQFGSGVRVSNEGTGTVTALIDNNTIQEVGDGNVTGFEGIFINETVNGGTTNVTITDNALDQIRDDRGINVQQVNGGGTLCSDISGNTLTNIFSATPLRVRQVTGIHNVRQLDPAGPADPNRLDTANGGVAVSVAGTITFNAGACPQP